MSKELIELKLLNTALDEQTTKLVEDRNHAVNKGWFDKAAKLNDVIEGIRKARDIANSGDCHLK